MGAISTVLMPSGTAVAVSVPAAPLVPAGVGAGFPKPQGRQKTIINNLTPLTKMKSCL